MSIPAIGPIAAAITRPVQLGTDPSPTQAVGGGFGTALANGLSQLQQTQSNADGLAVKAATGDVADVHDYMVAATQAQLATELTTAVRDKAVDAFNEIMRMQA